MTAGQIDTAIGNPPEIMCPGDDPYSDYVNQAEEGMFTDGFIN